MEIKLSKQVVDTLLKLPHILKNTPYELRQTTIDEKIAKMNDFFTNLLQMPQSNPVCNKKQLGQRFDATGNPIHLNLRRAVFTHNSSNWSISYYIQKNGNIRVHRMVSSNYVKNENINQRKGTILIKELDLRRIVRQLIREALNDRKMIV